MHYLVQLGVLEDTQVHTYMKEAPIANLAMLILQQPHLCVGGA